jgi:hypothetical protein
VLVHHDLGVDAFAVILKLVSRSMLCCNILCLIEGIKSRWASQIRMIEAVWMDLLGCAFKQGATASVYDHTHITFAGLLCSL